MTRPNSRPCHRAGDMSDCRPMWDDQDGESDRRAAALHADQLLGRRVRTFRLQAGLSQTDLAEKVGLTFQQVQKYEAGKNRIAVSRLLDIARALNVPLASFFDLSAEVEGTADDALKLYNVLATPEGQRLVAAFSAIPTPLLRRRVLNLIEAMVDDATT